MINNDISSHLNRYFNRSGKNDAASSAADLALKRLKARQEAATAGTAESEAAEDSADISMPAKQGVVGRGVLRHAAAEKAEKEKNAEKGGRVDADGKKGKNKHGAGAEAGAEAEEELSPMERRERELKAIMDKINAEEAMRYPGRNKPAEQTETAVANSDAAKNGEGTGLAVDSSGGLEGFLNDMPLFNEFKTGLMDAFSRLDSASMGAISAQYELNYTTMQYVANDLGGFEYQEQAVSVKLDLNYIKAAAGGQSGKAISEAIGKSEDFASLVENLQNVAAGQGQDTAGGAGQVSPDDFLASMQDYFSPEKTAERIVDFSSAFFGNSEAFRKYGDTEEGRSKFAETMRNAIQKGFDQAMGTLGKVPRNVQDGIDKTHELTFKGIDDFVKNGLNRNKQDNGVYNALEQFGFSFQMSYSSKTVSVSSSSAAANGNYGNYGNGNQYGNYANKPAATSAAVPGVDAQA